MTPAKRQPSPRRPAATRAARPGGAGRPRPNRPGARSRTLPIVAGVVGLVVLLAIVAALVAGGDDDSDDGALSVAPVTVEGASLPRYTGPGDDPAVGAAAPRLVGVDVTGAAAEAGGASGSPQLLVFVAHWCPHCQAEVPRIVEWMRDGQAPDGLEVTAVVTGTDSSLPNYPPSEWLADEGWAGGVVLDDERFSAGDAYGLSAYPFLVAVAPDGSVTARASGELPPDELSALVAGAVAG